MQITFRRQSLIGALALTLAMLAAGCGDSNNTSTGGTASKDKQGNALAAKLPANIRSAGTIKVGSDVAYAPVEFFDTDGSTIIGIDPDLAKAMGDKLGVKFQFTNATFDGLIPAVRSKRFDIVMSAMSDTKKRQAELDFVDYFNAGTSILVKKGNPDNINGLDDLCGKTVALQRGTTQEDVAKAQQAKCTAAGKGPIKVLTFDKDTDALLQIKGGRAVADMNDFPVAAYNAKTSGGGKDFEVVGEQIEAGPYGIGIRQEDTQLRDAIQAALKAVIADGSYDKVLEKWNVTKGALKTAAINGGS
ncbi:MAG: ABC transporter substrate-binding protein [Mycobacteriales bacterium]